MLSGHRPLYSDTANNIFTVTERHDFLFWFFYITAQRDGHAELVSASHCEPLLTPFPRWDPETSSGWLWEVLVISTPILEKPIQYLCQIQSHIVKYFHFHTPTWHRFQYEQKSAKYSSKTNLKSRSVLPYCEILIFQQEKNNFPTGK